MAYGYRTQLNKNRTYMKIIFAQVKSMCTQCTLWELTGYSVLDTLGTGLETQPLRFVWKPHWKGKKRKQIDTDTRQTKWEIYSFANRNLNNVCNETNHTYIVQLKFALYAVMITFAFTFYERNYYNNTEQQLQTKSYESVWRVFVP